MYVVLILYSKALACKCGVEFDIYYETVEAGINYK